MPISRRKFVGLSISTIGIAAAPTALHAIDEDGLRIDSHAHIFNARDFPLRGFVEKIVPNLLSEYGWIGNLAKYLAKRLVQPVLLQLAPSADDEQELLNEWDDFSEEVRKKMADKIVKYYGALARRYLRLDRSTRKALQQKFRKDAERELSKRTSDRASGVQVDETIIKDVNSSEDLLLTFLELAKKHAEEERGGDGAQQLFKPKGSLLSFLGRLPGARFIRFGSRLVSYRMHNALKYLDLYKDIDAFVAANVDFDYWLDGDTNSTSIEKQISLLSRISRLLDGRMLPMIGYNPWSSYENPGYLDTIKEGVAKFGIMGVKLYPPIGFRPYYNSGFVCSELPPHCPKGKRLDCELSHLYKWCVESEVPILAHAKDTLEAEKTYGERADPKFWNSLIENHPRLLNLSVMLGHSTGFDEVVQDGGWFQRAVEAANRNRVFLDFGNFTEIREEKNRTALNKAIHDSIDKSGGKLKHKICYASDWFMISKDKGEKSYLRNFESTIDHRYEQIMGDNATIFLGLNKSCQNRERFERFHFPELSGHGCQDGKGRDIGARSRNGGARCLLDRVPVSQDWRRVCPYPQGPGDDTFGEVKCTEGTCIE